MRRASRLALLAVLASVAPMMAPDPEGITVPPGRADLARGAGSSAAVRNEGRGAVEAARPGGRALGVSSVDSDLLMSEPYLHVPASAR